MSSYLVQRPDEKLQYTLDWSDWLGDGESITSRQWEISPSGPTLSSETTATVTLEGVTFGVLYRLVEKVITDQDQKGERALSIRCAT
jgi:hypothetical protein